MLCVERDHQLRKERAVMLGTRRGKGLVGSHRQQLDHIVMQAVWRSTEGQGVCTNPAAAAAAAAVQGQLSGVAVGAWVRTCGSRRSSAVSVGQDMHARTAAAAALVMITMTIMVRVLELGRPTVVVVRAAAREVRAQQVTAAVRHRALVQAAAPTAASATVVAPALLHTLQQPTASTAAMVLVVTAQVARQAAAAPAHACM